MRKTRSLAVVSEDNLITKIIKSLKNFLKVKQDNKEEVINRRAMVIKSEKMIRWTNAREHTRAFYDGEIYGAERKL